MFLYPYHKHRSRSNEPFGHTIMLKMPKPLRNKVQKSCVLSFLFWMRFLSQVTLEYSAAKGGIVDKDYK